jgi:hypothetical protein
MGQLAALASESDGMTDLVVVPASFENLFTTLPAIDQLGVKKLIVTTPDRLLEHGIANSYDCAQALADQLRIWRS